MCAETPNALLCAIDTRPNELPPLILQSRALVVVWTVSKPPSSHLNSLQLRMHGECLCTSTSSPYLVPKTCILKFA